MQSHQAENSTFELRRGRRTLSILIIVLVVLVFEPTIKWAFGGLLRTNPITFAGFDVTIPRRWMVRASDTDVQAWSPCWTRFCSGIKSSVKLARNESFVGYEEDTWRAVARKRLQGQGFIMLEDVTIESAVGRVFCLQGTGEADRSQVLCTCFMPQTGVVSTLVGIQTELKEYQQIVSSLRAARSEKP